jgi:hypothetical protein
MAGTTPAVATPDESLAEKPATASGEEATSRT